MSIGVLINHAIAFATNPLSVSLALIASGLVVPVFVRRAHRARPTKGSTRPLSTCSLHLFSSFYNLLSSRRLGPCLILAGLVYLWFMSSGLTGRFLGLSLEREFPPQRVEELPRADAIVILGGGMGGNTNTVYYPELYPSADRVVHAARIWKAGKAPVILASGTNELVATLPFLLELGVPQRAILVENKSGNTEENARFVARVLADRGACAREVARTPEHPRPERPRVLLVTSAWHMRRALLMFRKYAPDLEIIPAACDYEATLGSDEFNFLKSLLPGADALLHNSYMLKEIIGYWGYRLLR